MIEGLSERLAAARAFRPEGFLRFRLGTEGIGWIRRDLGARLRARPEVFDIHEESIALVTAPERDLTEAMAQVTRALAREGAIQGWRGETYAIRVREGAAPAFHIERAATRFFGLTSSAAHLNGYTGEGAKLRILIARRAAAKSIDPGLLDTLVAGGVPSGQDAWRTLLRECGEEAGIGRELAQNARPAGVLQVCREVPEGLHSELLYVYDLELPAGYEPRNADGEVSEFMRLDAGALLQRIARGEMTVEAGLVAGDFLLRQARVRDPEGAVNGAIEACRRVMLP